MTGIQVADLIRETEAVRAVFGPVHTEKELRSMNYGRGFDGHDGCWVNDYCCGPDCPMREHDGAPEAVVLRSRAVFRGDVHSDFVRSVWGRIKLLSFVADRPDNG